MKMIFLFLLLWTGIAFAGGEVNNGGDTVLCDKAVNSSYVGYYSLDFLMGQQTDNSDLVQLTSWDQSKNRLLNIFKEKDFDLYTLFKEYLSRVPGESTDNPDQQFIYQRIWDETPFGLVDLQDERIIKKIPPNCYHVGAGNRPNLIQTVIRQPKESVIIYNYDPTILKELKTKLPLQYSYLIVHEWLWDFTDDPDTIRRINRFLHSDKLEHLNSEQLKLSLDNIGLSLKYRTMKPVCERSEPIRQKLEVYSGVPCQQMSSMNFPNLILEQENFSMDRLGIVQLLPGDLSGLNIIKGISLADNLIPYLFEDTFWGMPELEVLEMSRNLIRRIPRGLFANNRKLEKIHFADNQIEVIEEDPQFSMDFLSEIDLSRNQLKDLPDSFIKNICGRPGQRMGPYFQLVGNPWANRELLKAKIKQACKYAQFDI